MPTLHGMLLNNVNILLNEAPLKGDPEDPVALFKEACKNEEENINVLFNTLNDANVQDRPSRRNVSLYE